MILIIGASGNVGRYVVPALKDAGAEVRVLEHDSPEPSRTAAVKADTADPASLDRAMAGVDTVFLLSPYSPALVENERNVVDAAARAGVGHLVKHSAFAADPDATSTVLRWHGESEAYLRASGIPFDIVRPNSFMQNIPAFFGQAVQGEAGISVAAGEGRVSFIDIADLARAYVTILTRPPSGETLDATGGEALSYREVADMLAHLIAAPVPYQPLTHDASVKVLSGAGFPEWMADGFTDYFEFQAADGCRAVSDAIQNLTGLEPNRMEAFLRADLSAFKA